MYTVPPPHEMKINFRGVMIMLSDKKPLTGFKFILLFTRVLDAPSGDRPRKTNIEPNNGGGRAQMIFLLKWVIFRFHVNFHGCMSGQGEPMKLDHFGVKNSLRF